MARPAHHALEIQQGDDWSIAVAWKDASAAAISMTQATAKMHIRKRVEDADYLVQLTNPNQILLEQPDVGSMTLRLSATETAALPPTDDRQLWHYDLEVKLSSGLVKTLIAGTVKVNAEVTR